MAKSNKQKQTGAQQIAVLKSLTSQAAAYLLGCHITTLRDRSHRIPPQIDGTYDAKEIIRFASNAPPPLDLDDDEHEKVLRCVETICFSGNDFSVPILVDSLRALHDRHGDSFYATFAATLVEHIVEYQKLCNLYDGRPDPSDFPSDEELLAAAKQDWAESIATARLERPAVCTSCDKVRNGKTWGQRELTKNGSKAPCSLPELSLGIEFIRGGTPMFCRTVGIF